LVSYYIYYRVRPDLAPSAARATLGALQAALARRTGVRGRLLHRADDAATFMEIYDDVSDADRFEDALRDEVDAHRADELLVPGTSRHMERFVPCA